MAKTFQSPDSRQPRGVDTDPAFKAAANAYSSGGGGETAAPQGGTAGASGHEDRDATEPGATGETGSRTPAAMPDATTPANGSSGDRTATPAPPTITPESKMTIYPGTVERSRLATIKLHHRLAESIVAEYALEELFRTRSDEDIATVLRSRGHGLRRARIVAT